MIPKANYHTHTLFCDGKDSMEDIVKEAIERNFTAIGFSGHAYMSMGESWCMSKENTLLYKEEADRLKKLYKDKITIYCGMEMDYFSEIDTSWCDYLIGSVHIVEKDGKYLAIDESTQEFARIVREEYQGDIYTLVEDYYALVSKIAEKTNCNIIGHFDLITKFNEGDRFFSQTHPRYIKAAESAAKKLLEKNIPFEVNTGGICRGYTKTPYPSEHILKMIKKQGRGVVLSSDAHKKENIDFYFEEAEEYLKKLGVKVIYSMPQNKKIELKYE